MKNLIFTVLLAIFTLTLTFSQGCLPEGVIFHYQDDIDDFQTNYPGCTEIEGSLQIDGTYIDNLNGLSILTSIGGNLQIGDGFETNPQLTDLTGLENITYIGGELMIYNNLGLISTSGLDNVTYIGEKLLISNNQLLENIEGLINISVIHGQLKINYNSSLANLHEFEAITTVEGHLEITFNYALTNLIGLHNITEVGENLLINGNNALTNLEGLDNISYIGNNLSIRENLNLLNLTGLENITYVSKHLAITGNPSLNSFVGLHNLTEVDTRFEIIDNDALVNITGLESLLDIKQLYLMDNDSLINLEGLSMTEIAWTLWVKDNNSLESLNGLQSNTSFHSIYIQNNSSLQSLSGLDNLSHAGTNAGGFEITDNASLTSLNGLENLTYISGFLHFENNPLLANMDGLSGLTSVSGNLEIINNNSLISLAGLYNLTSVEEEIIIEDNGGLTSLEGLNYIEKNSFNELHITGNGSLSTCDIESICYYIYNPNGSIEINNNATGCNSSEEIKNVCIYCCQDGLSIYNQTTIDNFKINYPNCSELGGFLKIKGSTIIDLNNLDNLLKINGDLEVTQTNSLQSLSGLDNINAASVDALRISGNDSLSNCHVKSICDYLAAPNGTVFIQGNALGCNSQEEVEVVCELSIDELGKENGFTISPNPIGTTTIIEYTLQTNSPVSIQILDISGQEIKTLVNETHQKGEYKLAFDGTDLKAGIYFCVLKTNEGVMTTKMISL